MAGHLVKAIVLALIAVSVTAKDYTIGDFKKNYFKIITATKGFYEVKAGFENVTDEIIIGSGFVNKDLYVDIITVTKNRKTGHFYIYDDEANKFKINMSTPDLAEGETIVNIKLTQIRSLGSFPDVVVISQIVSNGVLTMKFRGYSIDNIASGDYEYSMTLISAYYVENMNTTSDKTQEPFNIQMFEENKLVDYWLLMENGKRVVYYFDKDTAKFEKKDFSDLLDKDCNNCMNTDQISNKVIPAVYTSAFIDVNRDCRADIILETKDKSGNRYLEFYYYMNSKFGLINVVPIPDNYSLGVVEDINENNNPDLLFIEKDTGKLQVFLNSYSLNNSSDEYCAKTVSTEFMYPSLVDSSNKNYLITQELVKDSKLFENSDVGIQGFIRLGDLDLDSFKDLTLNLTVNGKTDVYVFLNKPCDAGYISDTGFNSDLCRYFDHKAVSDEDTSVMKGKNAVQSIFFDLGERG